MIAAKTKGVLLGAILCIISITSWGQGLTVNARLDTNIIMIGDQIKFHLEIEQAKSFMVDFPIFPDTITEKVEIIDRGNIDTTYLSADILKLTQEFTITSFDSGFHVIPPLPFPFRGNGISDTALSRPLALGVYTFQIDSVQGITDIKPPIDTPLTFKETLPYIGWSALGLAILVALFFLIRMMNRKEVTVEKRAVPKEPPHVIAMRDLDKLADKKLWQQSKFKEYHSELTGIIRTYVEYRFQIMAMEQTSDEIIEQFERNSLLTAEQFEHLKEMLSLADFVKFAKMHPLPDENERSIKNAYDFVLKTKQKVDLTTKKEASPQSTENSPLSAVGSDQSAVNSQQSIENSPQSDSKQSEGNDEMLAGSQEIEKEEDDSTSEGESKEDNKTTGGEGV